MVAYTDMFGTHVPTQQPAEVVATGQLSRLHWRIALLLLALQFLPYLLLWNESYIRIHDTLEGIDYQNLFRAGMAFDYSPGAKLEQVMNGLPRAAVKTGWSFIALWHWVFGLYGGYIFNYLLVHITAFGGMLLLLRNHFTKTKDKEWLAVGVALCFSWVPFFTMLGMSVAGLPLVAWALCLPKHRLGAKLAVLTLFPFYSDIVWAGVPVLAFGGAFFLLQKWNTGRWDWPLFLAIAWMAVLYIAINWQLFQITFAPGGFLSHRVEYDYFYNKALSPWHSLKETAMVFFLCHHHIGVFVSVPVMLATGSAWKWFGFDKTVARLAAAILVASIFYGFYNYIVWVGSSYFELLKSFKFERAIVMLPVLWLVLFTLVLEKIAKRNRQLALWFLTAQLAICMVANDEFSQNLRQLANQPRKPNFKAFFDEKLFTEIDQFIDLPKESYRVVSLGMHPSVAQYNGFYTLDRHASLYDLRYKHQFRCIMANELKKSAPLLKEFDHFGNRCYLYSAELGKDYDAFLCGKNTGRSICQLDLNIESLCAMGGCYLFSAVEIGNAADVGLRLKKVFEGRFWQVHLYKVEADLLAQGC